MDSKSTPNLLPVFRRHFLQAVVQEEKVCIFQEDHVWEAVVAAAQNIDRQQIKKLTDSMNGRLINVIEKGGYIGFLNVYLYILSFFFIILTLTDENKK